MSVGTVFVYLFYAAMFVALAYFIHKLVWFVRFRRLQEELVARATARLEGGVQTHLTAWENEMDASWHESDGSSRDPSPERYVRRVEETLLRILDTIRESRTPIKPPFVQALLGHPPADQDELLVVSIPTTKGALMDVRLSMRFPQIGRPQPPADELYEIEADSRYGLLPRLLAFFLGAADVLYSAQHVAKMSQNAQMPAGVMIRRLSLVALVLVVVVFDIAFGVRRRLIEAIEPHADSLVLGFGGSLGALLDEHIATLAGLGVWLAGYGVLYFGLYLFLRRRSQMHLRRLRKMREGSSAMVDAIHDRHVREVVQWGRSYARSLDEQVLITLRQAEMLVGRAIHRLRRRFAGKELLEIASKVRDALFTALPESSRSLQDVATTHPHSWRHYLWPRVQEMRYHVQLAQYRHAWQQLSVTLTELRGERPDPRLARELWRALVRYAEMFPEIVPSGIHAALDRAYERASRRLVEESDDDLRELDRRLSELARSLGEKLEVVASLVDSRVELAEQMVEADVARLTAEVLHLRERARLEAMAFEI